MSLFGEAFQGEEYTPSLGSEQHPECAFIARGPHFVNLAPQVAGRRKASRFHLLHRCRELKGLSLREGINKPPDGLAAASCLVTTPPVLGRSANCH